MFKKKYYKMSYESLPVGATFLPILDVFLEQKTITLNVWRILHDFLNNILQLNNDFHKLF